MNFLRENQLNIMLILIGVCGMLSIFSFTVKTLSPRRKAALTLMNLGSMLILIADRYSYIYKGDISEIGHFMVRLGNFMVFTLTLVIIYAFNEYLADLFKSSTGKTPRSLRIVYIFIVLGILLVIISQFTGFYYTFDKGSNYIRGKGFLISYILPLTIFFLQLFTIIRYRKAVRTTIYISVLMFSTGACLASFMQLFFYGISFINMTTSAMMVIFYLLTIKDVNDTIENSYRREIELLETDRKEINKILIQTATALAGAVDAKDEYTHGHSRRVAEYAQMIAELSGKSDSESWIIYLAGLLHDIGKIGIPDNIINKTDKLTDEEYETVKTHPVIGNKILGSIKKIPALAIAAHYHHERYDGKGYPEGLAGENIPEYARIVAVADTYDAMTSKRSYRAPLPQKVVRQTIKEGAGTQFDPRFAEIMLQLIDNDKNYTMKQDS